jgi:type II secretory pathway component PulF
MIALLADAYPRPGVARRLERAADQVARGVHWCDALSAERLLSQADRAVLRAAERVGNLPWALAEMADSTARRFATRLRMAVDLLLPVVVLIMGVAVLFIFVSLFLPLVSMIQGLS